MADELRFYGLPECWRGQRSMDWRKAGFFGGVLSALRSCPRRLRVALAEVAWWDYAGIKQEVFPQRELRRLSKFRHKTGEEVPVLSGAEESALRGMMERLGWRFCNYSNGGTEA